MFYCTPFTAKNQGMDKNESLFRKALFDFWIAPFPKIRLMQPL